MGGGMIGGLSDLHTSLGYFRVNAEKVAAGTFSLAAMLESADMYLLAKGVHCVAVDCSPAFRCIYDPAEPCPLELSLDNLFGLGMDCPDAVRKVVKAAKKKRTHIQREKGREKAKRYNRNVKARASQ